MKNIVIAVVLAAGVAGAGFADTLKGFDVEINMDADAFRLEDVAKSDEDKRAQGPRNTGRTIAWPFGSYDWDGDTTATLSYDGGFYGGAFGLGLSAPDSAGNFAPRISALRAWIHPMKYFRITAGLDIPSEYADNLDADPEMRIYSGVTQANWDESRQPDNITQDRGVLVEGFLGDLTLAFTGRYYIPSLFSVSLNQSDPPETRNTRYAKMEQVTYAYGARAGYRIGAVGTVNASYIAEYANNSGQNYTRDTEGNVVPNTGRAEITAHLFGVYASLTPLRDLGVSLSYNGIFTQYVDEIFSGPDLVNSNWHKTALPQVYRQAVNLNARYKGVPGFTFRTDNNISFWTDKDYTIFDLALAEPNIGTLTETQGAGYADVAHLLLWNGLGIAYAFTPSWRIELYAYNLYRRDTATGLVNNIDREFAFTRNKISGELKGVWQPTEAVEASVGVAVEHMLTTTSADVHRHITGPTGSNRADYFTVAQNVKETNDTRFVVRIPLKLIVKMR